MDMDIDAEGDTAMGMVAADVPVPDCSGELSDDGQSDFGGENGADEDDCGVDVHDHLEGAADTVVARPQYAQVPTATCGKVLSKPVETGRGGTGGPSFRGGLRTRLSHLVDGSSYDVDHDVAHRPKMQPVANSGPALEDDGKMVTESEDAENMAVDSSAFLVRGASSKTRRNHARRALD
eukprot:gnl/MRDRNA2_/MRDRNA2_111347_c0_seq1.p1 gnl/MRDRNA2_/MRDRNA2_111347_c0~~gnl/MRDRNA2_/MRDRNA2_111347_c0_seq1.p1  ORF type:complete len:179 (-),score=45.44 gnl/MRDRNA2_/MRDRNA2_111347_c0_seq1:52-588(-)